MAKENNNKSFVLRIDAATMDALELWAADEFRSINGQLQWIIADALRRSGTDGPAVMVGDRRFDVAGAHENGLPAIGVLYGACGRRGDPAGRGYGRCFVGQGLPAGPGGRFSRGCRRSSC